MKHEVEMALRLLFRSDTSIPPDGRVDQAIEILKGHNAKEPPVVRVGQAANILHVERQTVINLAKKGKLVRILERETVSSGFHAIVSPHTCGGRWPLRLTSVRLRSCAGLWTSPFRGTQPVRVDASVSSPQPSVQYACVLRILLLTIASISAGQVFVRRVVSRR